MGLGLALAVVPGAALIVCGLGNWNVIWSKIL